MNREKKPIDQGEIASGMVLFGLAGFIFTVILASYIYTVSIALFIIEILSIVIGLIILEIEKRNNQAAYFLNVNIFQKEYDEYAAKLGVVKSKIRVTLLKDDEHDFQMEMPQYLWVEKDCINLFPMAQYYIKWHTSSVERPNISELRITSIPIKSILHFKKAGRVYRHEIEVPEKSVVKHLFHGEVILDASGEVIGIEQLVKTKIITEDKRRTELVYKKSRGKIKTLIFRHDAYETFKELIPSKER